jgi:OOP family OmpA-OmpF porin
MKKFLLGAVMAATAIVTGSTALAADDTGAWYVSPMAQYHFLDNKRVSKSDVGYQLGLGYDFASNLAAELNYGQGGFKIKNSGASQRLTNYSLDLLWKFMPESTVRPYLLAGAGETEDSIGGVNNHHAAAAEVGAGLLVGLGSQTGSSRIQLRTEAKYREEFAGANAFGGKNPGDVIVGLGLQFMFGAPAAAAAVAVAPVVAPPLDSDGDGVPDSMDKCPNTPHGVTVDASGCPLDSDGDGVPDYLDKCPNTPHGVAVNATGCPLDSDGDGVPDYLDKCPNTPKGDKVDVNGCTVANEIKLPGVNFETNKWVLLPESTTTLDEAAATLKKYPSLVVEVHGHTDSRGSVKHNLVLSQHRAEAVMKYLKDHGVTNSMTAKGFGVDHAVASNETAEGRAQNRRVSIRIVGGN